MRIERKGGKEERRERDRVQEIKEVDDNAAVVRPLAQGRGAAIISFYFFRAYAAISAGDRPCARTCARVCVHLERSGERNRRGSERIVLFVKHSCEREPKLVYTFPLTRVRKGKSSALTFPRLFVGLLHFW